MKRVFIFLLTFLTLTAQPVSAVENTERPNNKFGIHLAIPSHEDLQEAAKLVNSAGGDWGYVTLVLEENDRNRDKWQEIFNQMRRLHLIPIIRLATFMENDSWHRPDPGDAEKWVDFLNSLNWVVKDRYVVLFNEPNRGDEWGGQVDPVGYASVAFEFTQKLKEKNSDFFVMMAGFDAAAPHKLPDYEDEEIFLRQMLASLRSEGKEIFNYLDGWASHSYPNHGFVGSPYGVGRNSIRTYLWELSLLRMLGVGKNLPVFITETGWPHAEGKNYQRNFYSADEVAANFKIYFSQLTTDPKVAAITPFILNYQGEPFDHFSWRKLGGGRDYYTQYEAVRNLAKARGAPKQEQKLKITHNLPQKVIANSTYTFPLNVRNEGQAIWSKIEGYQMALVVPQGDKFEHFFTPHHNAPLEISQCSDCKVVGAGFTDFSEIPPFSQDLIWLYLKTGEKLGKFDLGLVVTKDREAVSNEENWSLEIIPAVDVDFKVSLFPKKKSEGKDFKLLIYNDKEEVVFEKDGIEVKDGQGEVKEVKNLAIGQKYRIVILKKYYLPRQGFLTVGEKDNQVTFERMLPLDFNFDGKFSLGDSWSFITHPKLFSLLWPG